jgi:AcrR family transcriptional regulator
MRAVTDTNGSRYGKYLLPSIAVSTPTDGRSTRWDEHRTTRRRELVEATVRAIRLHGAAVGMDDIAAMAGTSKTVIYRHFADRAGLYAAVSQSVDARILRDLGQAMGSAGADLTAAQSSPRDLIAAAIDAYLKLVEKDPEVYRFVVNAPLLDAPAGGDPAGPVTGHIAEQMSAVIAQALVAAGEEAEAASVWGAGLVGMVRAAADQWLTRPETMTRARLTDHLTDLAWSGLSTAWPSHSEEEHR